jgi:site-specific recombinase XerD
LAGVGPVVTVGNRFLGQLVVREFSPVTVRAYAFDLVNFDRFLVDSSLELADVASTDVFGYLEW